MNSRPVIEFLNVSLRYETRLILNSVDFTLQNGEFAYLVGATGTGKSSFLKCIYRDVVPQVGTIRVDGDDITALPQRKVPYLRRKLGIVFQDFQLLPDRSAYDNVAFALQVTGNPARVIKERVMEVLTLVGLSNKRTHLPHELSGGEQQRVVIARALANEPRILLADEPTGNLDPDASNAIMDVLQTINTRGMAVLMVTHNLDLVKRYPFRTLRLADGTLTEEAVV
jgi:cell division transport system ATP-binding protein